MKLIPELARILMHIVTLKILTNMITILEVVTIFSPSPVFLWLTIKERLLNYREMQSSFCKYQIAFRTKKNYFCTSKRNRPNITLLINSKTNILNISHNHSHVIKYSKNIISNLSIRDCWVISTISTDSLMEVISFGWNTLA